MTRDRFSQDAFGHRYPHLERALDAQLEHVRALHDHDGLAATIAAARAQAIAEELYDQAGAVPWTY